MVTQSPWLERIGLAVFVAATLWIVCRVWDTHPFPSSVPVTAHGLLVPERLDFPAVPLGGTVEKNLEIKNTTNSDITIYEVEATCGCTRVKTRRVTLAPQETVQFPISIHGSYYSSLNGDKALRVRASDGRYFIEVHTAGIAGLSVSPTVLDFGTITPDQLPANKVIAVFGETLTPEQLQSIRATSRHPSIQVSSIRFDDHGKGDVSATILKTPISGLIWSEIEFTGAGIDKIQSSVSVRIDGAITARPSSLVIRPGTSHPIEIRSSKSTSMEVIKVLASSDLLPYLKIATNPPQAVVCSLDLTVKDAISTVVRGELTIDVKADGEVTHVLIPVTAILK